MKTKIEFGEYTVEIEELEGVLTVKAEKEGEEDDKEVVEEFSLSLEDGDEAPEGEEGSEDLEDVKNFDDFAQEEDFEGEEEAGEEAGEEDFEEPSDDDDNDDTQLESFQSFIKKRK